MQTSSLTTIKNELEHLPKDVLVDICVRIAKYKKENKELLNYLLFENSNEQEYIESVKTEMEEEFATVNISSMFFTRKSIRRILRLANKYIRYSGKTETEIEILIHFCKQIRTLQIDYRSSTAMVNLYESQLKRIRKALKTLHEDLQYEYQNDLEILTG